MLGAARKMSGFALVLVAAASIAWAGDEAAGPKCNAGENPQWQEACADVRRLVDELRAEVDAMKDVREAQKQLMAWNGERAEVGLSAMTLRPELCLEEEIKRWCRLLPATFGVAEGRR